MYKYIMEPHSPYIFCKSSSIYKVGVLIPQQMGHMHGKIQIGLDTKLTTWIEVPTFISEIMTFHNVGLYVL